MSRSYKKTPYSGDRKNKEGKRHANREFRSKIDRLGIDEEIPPSLHRKLSETWNICDYSEICSLPEWLKNRKRSRDWRGEEFDEDDETLKWKKWFKWK